MSDYSLIYRSGHMNFIASKEGGMQIACNVYFGTGKNIYTL